MNFQWIPCSYILPATIDNGCKVVDEYLVTVKIGEQYFVDTATNWGNYIDDFWQTTNDWVEEEECHVIAWSPLPEPYKEDKSV